MNRCELDLPIIKLLSNRENYDIYNSRISRKHLSEEAAIILQDFDHYYSTQPNEDISAGDFYDWFCNARHKGFTEDKKALFQIVITRALGTEVSEPKHLLMRLKYEELLEEFLKNNDLSVTKIKQIVDKYQEGLEVLDDSENLKDYTPLDVNGVFATIDRTTGLKWRLRQLNESIGGLIRGDMCIIAAYTDTGKTAFVASEATHMATQVSNMKRVLWFNNEGSNERVQIRLLCAALGKTQSQIQEHKERALLWYKKIMNADSDRILVYPAHGKTTQYIEDRCNDQESALIVIDQIDNIEGYGKKENEVIKSRYLYQWARELSTQHAPLLAVTQASGSTSYVDRSTGEEEHQLYVGMHQLDWSKVAKQSAAEIIITIGRHNTIPNQRGIHVPKNKSNIDSNNRNPKFLAHFNGATSRYED